MKRILIFGARTLPNIFFNLIPINELIKRNFRVTYINAIKLFPNAPQNVTIDKIHSDYVEYIEVLNINHVEKIIGEYACSKCYAVLLGWPIHTSDILKPFLQKQNIKTIRFNLVPINNPSKLEIVVIFLKRILRKINKNDDIVIVEAQYKRKLFKLQGYQNIWLIHSHIYENYFQLINSTNYNSKDSYILYIGQNFMNHPDFSMFNIEKNNFIKYYEHIKILLKKVEEYYNLKVIIALHPTSDEKTYSEIFNEFTVVKHNSFELIDNAKYLIGHFSGVMDYAMLHKKNIVSIRIPKVYSKKISNNQKIYIKKTNVKSISHKRNKMPIFPKNPTPYASYIHKFIKSNESPQKSFSDIFFSYMENI